MPLGITCKTYVNLSTWAAPNWELLRLIGDMTPNMGWNLGDGSTRDIRLVMQEPTNMTIELSGRVRKSMTNTAFLAMRAAFLIAGVLDVMLLDASLDTNNAEGVRCEFKVGAFGEPQGLQDVVFKEFTMSPCISEHYPQSVIVIAGTPDFTDINPPDPNF